MQCIHNAQLFDHRITLIIFTILMFKVSAHYYVYIKLTSAPDILVLPFDHVYEGPR